MKNNCGCKAGRKWVERKWSEWREVESMLSNDQDDVNLGLTSNWDYCRCHAVVAM